MTLPSFPTNADPQGFIFKNTKQAQHNRMTMLSKKTVNAKKSIEVKVLKKKKQQCTSTKSKHENRV